MKHCSLQVYDTYTVMSSDEVYSIRLYVYTYAVHSIAHRSVPESMSRGDRSIQTDTDTTHSCLWVESVRYKSENDKAVSGYLRALPYL